MIASPAEGTAPGWKEPTSTERAFRIGAWAGIPNYECNHCAYATLDLETIRDHVVRRHGLDAAEDGTIRRPQMRKVQGLILGPDGKPITHIPIKS